MKLSFTMAVKRPTHGALYIKGKVKSDESKLRHSVNFLLPSRLHIS